MSPGQIGRYRIVREIARSNDIVYEAVDTSMNRQVAVKELLLPPNVEPQPRRDRIERFYREARAAGQLSHPNIVTIHEVGEDSGRFFLAMEYLEGQTLRQRLSVGGPLPLSEVVAIGVALCDALDYAHQHGVVHRDIKPDNVHLLPGGRVKLTDFGIARILHESQLTLAGQVFGTPSYMSPEQIKGGAVDSRSDIFSLGILLFEMLAGRKPFTGDSVVTITYRILHEPMPTVPGATPALEAVVHRATAKDPEHRFSSASEMRVGILSAAASRTGAFGPAGVAPPVPQASTVPPQPTALYGTQTRFGIAPGHTGDIGVPVARRSGEDEPDAVPYEEPGASMRRIERRYRARAVIATTLVLCVITGLLTVAMVRAFRNYEQQASLVKASDSYNNAVKLYERGQYEAAALAFSKVRVQSKTPAATRRQALDGEVYCYRHLGHLAQQRGDLPGALRWYEKALAVSPDDTQAREERDAARRVAGSGAAESTPSPSPLGTSQNPPPANAGPPSRVTTRDFLTANASAAQEAQTLFQRGEEAWQQGNRQEALRMWTAAVAAGPGSRAAVDAQQRLSQYAENGGN
jgi:serine/threonine-protein kinase